MANLDDYVEYLEAQHERLGVGEEFILSVLMGDRWDEIGSDGEKRNFGTQYHAAVAAGRFPRILYGGIRTNGRSNFYRKT